MTYANKSRILREFKLTADEFQDLINEGYFELVDIRGVQMVKVHRKPEPKIPKIKRRL